jgi:hypothetical protein
VGEQGWERTPGLKAGVIDDDEVNCSDGGWTHDLKSGVTFREDLEVGKGIVFIMLLTLSI